MYTDNRQFTSIIEAYDSIFLKEDIKVKIESDLTRLVKEFPGQVVELFKEIISKIERGEGLENIKSIEDLENLDESFISQKAKRFLNGVGFIGAGSTTLSIASNTWIALAGKAVEAGLINSNIAVPLATALSSAPPFLVMIVFAALIALGVFSIVDGIKSIITAIQ